MTDVLSRLTSALSDRYTIERELGAGGMATVYLAEDLKHHRKVAIKVLRPELAAVLGAERFVQEITTTANLQHPHILPLFDSGEAEGFLYYVMPFIDGETLRDKLNRETQLGIEEAVKITTEVADALDYAHHHNVIHRDIKPENILLHDGRPMVADFGIALAVSAVAGGRMTETGLSLGTPHYMSPEQATAEKDPTNRSDIYSLGAVLYELLTGEPPHMGNSAQQIIMKIVTDEARPVRELRKSVPPNVAAATAKALEKLPADRFSSAADFAAALTNSAFTLPTAGRETPAAPTKWAWNRLSIGTTVAAAAFAIIAIWGMLSSDSRGTVSRYGLAMLPGQEPSNELLAHSYFDIAPDGSWIVYVGPGERGGQLWVKPRDEYEAMPLSGTEGARGPTISPDGQWIAFTVGGALRRTPAAGGPLGLLADSVNSTISHRAAWLDDGTVVYVDPDFRLLRAPAIGGQSEVVWEAQDIITVTTVSPLPKSQGVLFIATGMGFFSDLWVLDLRDGEAHHLLDDVQWAHYASTGHLVAGHPGQVTDVFAIPFDLETLQTTGVAVQLFEGVGFSVLSREGTLLMELFHGGYHEAVWVSRDGVVTSIDPSWQFRMDAFTNYGWALSPDGTRLAIGIPGEGGSDIWIKQLDDGPESRLTFDDTWDFRPRWTSGGRSVTYVSYQGGGESGVYTRRADGTGQAELVFSGGPPSEVTVDENELWFISRTGLRDGGRDIVGFRPGVDSVAVPLLDGEYDEMAPALSPDGRWLAYTSTESGRSEVYVRPFPDVETGRSMVSSGGGFAPLWAHSGRELFYISAADEVVAASVETDPTFEVTERRALFVLTPDFVIDRFHTAHDISPDDQRFVMVRSVGVDVRQLIVVENFFEELREKVGQEND